MTKAKIIEYLKKSLAVAQEAVNVGLVNVPYVAIALQVAPTLISFFERDNKPMDHQYTQEEIDQIVDERIAAINDEMERMEEAENEDDDEELDEEDDE